MKLKKIAGFVLLIAFLFLSSGQKAVCADATYEKLKIMIDVMEIIKNNYVDEKDTKDMASGAIRGVVGTLDPFSQYMEEKAYKDMKEETAGEFSGIGIRIMTKNDFITVVSPIPDTPAYKAGMLPGDRIIKINNKNAVSMPQEEAVNMMKGKSGTKVTITVSRDNVFEPIDFVLTRDKIKIETVRSLMLEGDIAYIRLTEFNAKSADDVQKAFKKFVEQGAKGLIFDLRNNPGGLLDSAIDIISLFVKDKTLALTTKGRNESMKREYFTSGAVQFEKFPLIILVNRGSASASEIVTGAMQDFKRALIIGANTFGKGSVQTIIPLSDGTALRLTIAKYYLPSGRPIMRTEGANGKNGITPDIEFNLTIEDEIKLYIQSDLILEKYKKGALKVEDKVSKQPAQSAKAAVAKSTSASSPKDAGDKKDDIDDIVLAQAIKIMQDNKVAEMITKSKVDKTK
ncbi:MAG: S41 family peptidase [Elusimicrobiota bacterium]|jgi:carboxyl-terminal processing protease|nr:S41 family peptidase [Elusimicrobiota bacterium]